jgi:hypothetical protein
MKLMRSVFIILTVFVSFLHCSDQRPRDWKDVVSFLNPFATFRPSIISKGHAQYFEEVGSLSNEQKDNLKKFVTQLKYAKLGISLVVLFSGVNGLFSVSGLQFHRYTFPLWVLFAVNAIYARDLRRFQEKLDDSRKSKKS